MPEDKKIAITGCGTVSPYGVGVATFWQRLLAGASAVSEISDSALRQWVPVAAEASSFNAEQYLGKKQIADTDRFTQMAMVAAMEALADAKVLPSMEETTISELDTNRIGISLGSAFGGVQSLESGAWRLATQTSSRVGPRLVSKSIPNAAAAAIAMRYLFRGPVLTYATACASSSNAIGEAMFWLRSGQVDMVLAGGAEHLFTPSVVAGLRAAGALAQSGPDDYSKWSRPFDVNRKGMVMGEGAAFVVLEPLDRALARGAHIYAELAGYGTSNDAYHETSPEPDGLGAALAMERALQSAGWSRTEVDYVNAHATSTPAGDSAESKALRRIFGEHLPQMPVSSIKGAVGHMLGVAGAIECIACAQALETGWLPPTINCTTPDEVAPPDIVPNQGRQQKVSRVLSNSFGFGGQNAVLALQAYEQ